VFRSCQCPQRDVRLRTAGVWLPSTYVDAIKRVGDYVRLIKRA
jgi:hypothetical protein